MARVRTKPDRIGARRPFELLIGLSPRQVFAHSRLGRTWLFLVVRVGPLLRLMSILKRETSDPQELWLFSCRRGDRLLSKELSAATASCSLPFMILGRMSPSLSQVVSSNWETWTLPWIGPSGAASSGSATDRSGLHHHVVDQPPRTDSIDA